MASGECTPALGRLLHNSGMFYDVDFRYSGVLMQLIIFLALL